MNACTRRRNIPIIFISTRGGGHWREVFSLFYSLLSPPKKIALSSSLEQGLFGKTVFSPGLTRTGDPVVNSHLLYRLSYRGLHYSEYMYIGKKIFRQ